MIEIKCARRRHPVIDGQNYLSRQSSNRSRRRYYDDLVQPIDDVITCENQNRPPLIGKPKRILADLTTPHPTSSPALCVPSKWFLIRRKLVARRWYGPVNGGVCACLLYTSDAADE